MMPGCGMCGRPEHRHSRTYGHAFQPVYLPAGCRCQPQHWWPPEFAGIPAPCHRYVAGWDGHCRHCGHQEACCGR